MDLDFLFRRVTERAYQEFDGHFTVLSFSTGFKGAFGTVDMDSGEGREQIGKLQTFNRLSDLLAWMLIENPRF